MRWVIGTVLIFLPNLAVAAVTINEIVWMGSSASANAEWIELYNDSGNVDVTGWTLTDGMNLNITLTGSIGAGQYAVLERTSDESAPGNAFMIYTGALVNTGATLTLRDASLTLQDQVAGGDNWELIGGDNTTKETAQYTPAGWITAAGTPGSQNASVASTQPVTSTESNTPTTTKNVSTEPVTTSSRKSSDQSIEMKLADKNLSLVLRAPTLAYVNQPVSFSVEPQGLSDGLLDSLKFNWNFGDVTTEVGREVIHSYAFPGHYVVSLEGEFARHQAAVRHEITILPVTLSLTHTAAGDVQVHNNAKYEVDLSGYSVRGKHTLVFPERTILLPHSTLTIPAERLGGTTPLVGLFDQETTLVASTLPQSLIATVAEAAPTQRFAITSDSEPIAATPSRTHVHAAPPTIINDSETNFSFRKPAPEVVEGTTTAIVEAFATTAATSGMALTAAAPAAGSSLPAKALPYLGLIAVLAIGIFGIYANKVTAS